MSYDTRYAGMGRDELLQEIRHLERERDAYLENLTAVQERCTELLLELRKLRGEVAA